MHNSENSASFWFYLRLTLLTWFAIIGIDFFIHAGLLAGLYTEPNPFLLPPEQAFAMIPVGYLSFLALAVLLLWLMAKIGIRGWRQGAVFGLQFGLISGISSTLGLFSIATVPPVFLGGWFLGQVLELCIAGMVAGSGLENRRLGRLFLRVLVFVIAAVVITIILQNVGLAPAVKM